MPIRLDARAPDFAEKFRAFLDTKREASADVEQAVRAIIADVAERGDAALIELTKRFDRVDLSATGVRVTQAELEAAIAPVAKIVGPGNAYVAAAKRLVFGRVGIDMIAGPSEVLIIADRDANPEWVAADLLAQAEHDAAAQSILITDNAALADGVARAVEGQLKTLPRELVASASWRDFGAIILVGKLDDAVPLVD